ncbi:hypothetical protein KIN20_032062 [Parelaphostrongylus tenuis]|uniref:Uncharacterized protein n=1 Tax=Parelaphostrongylus tenuis TaxID=148309 RepID=A0AAD5WH86_PARTN|nr:hypothetical protein KIN20_032062 [Parelaphostrongylus tenuis]
MVGVQQEVPGVSIGCRQTKIGADRIVPKEHHSLLLCIYVVSLRASQLSQLLDWVAYSHPTLVC